MSPSMLAPILIEKTTTVSEQLERNSSLGEEYRRIHFADFMVVIASNPRQSSSTIPPSHGICMKMQTVCANPSPEGGSMRDNAGLRKKQGRRPDLNSLYALPLPLNTFPLPPLIPHNPISLLQILYVFISQSISPPSSHPQSRYRGHFSPHSCSVHVTDPTAVRALWEKGFFGKGNLSRSEPTWLDREKKRRGLAAGLTSEEVTRKRREERKEFKKERARKEREAIELRRQEESKKESPGNASVNSEQGLGLQPLIKKEPELDLVESPGQPALAEPRKHVTSHPDRQPQTANGQKGAHFGAPSDDAARARTDSDLPLNKGHDSVLAEEEITNQEHLQLTMEEAFFLTYALGVLDVFDEDQGTLLTPGALLPLMRRHSHSPPVSPGSLQPDDPFLLSYVVYHHFRSLGWVVRSGVKFAVDFLLYNRGPVFAHAEFAVVIIPSYSVGYDTQPSATTETSSDRSRREWWWLHCINRVQAQVRKSLVLAYVEVPPMKRGDVGAGDCTDITGLLRRYRVREVNVKRWIPNRSRD